MSIAQTIMSTFAIGDLQGCYSALQQLLEKINYNPSTDQLWFVGDLVNRGDQSLEVLRFIKNLPNVKVVLGNHDIYLLALAYGNSNTHHTLHEILKAPDRDELINWLRKLPLLHHSPELNYVMTHAGIYPFWDLEQAKKYAREVEAVLCSQALPELLKNIYGDEPDQWNENLSGWSRLRFITNAFTRMRFCSLQGKLEFHAVKGLDSQPPGYVPWFKIKRHCPADVKIIFGHWAALMGVTNEANIFALDTGCVWGNYLTAMRLEDQQRFSVPWVF